MQSGCHRVRIVLGICLLACGLTGIALADDKALKSGEHKELDGQLVEMLRDVHNRGAELYNGGDVAGCYRMFQGALMAVRPALALHPELQKTIDAGLAGADRNPRVDQRAFALHDLIEKVRAELKGGTPVKPAEKMPTGKKPEEIKTVPKKAEEKKSIPVVPIAPPPEKTTESSKKDEKKSDTSKKEDKKPVGTESVQGKITFKGKPLSDGAITFVYSDKETVEGKIGADGTYGVKSAKVGRALVAIKATGTPLKYASAETSGLVVEVKKGKQTFDFSLE